MQEQTEKDNKDMESDPLKDYLKQKKKEALSFISAAARLIAPTIE